MSDQSEQMSDDQWQDRSMEIVYQFGLELKQLHASNPWPDRPLLPRAINQLMTELWDRCFSQTEIREAFEAAIADLPRYAAGDEIRP